jgi:hypothetical protein
MYMYVCMSVCLYVYAHEQTHTSAIASLALLYYDNSSYKYLRIIRTNAHNKHTPQLLPGVLNLACMYMRITNTHLSYCLERRILRRFTIETVVALQYVLLVKSCVRMYVHVCQHVYIGESHVCVLVYASYVYVCLYM